MKKIVAFGASNSRQSINQKLASWAAEQLSDVSIDLLDLNDFEMPIYSIDRETESGIPEKAKAFKETVKEADGIIISLAEHNGCYTSAFKNIIDWVSRIEKGTWAGKPVLLLSTSPGPRGGAGVIGIAKNAFPYQGAIVTGAFSLPSFNQNFDEGIVDAELRNQFHEALNTFNQTIDETETQATAARA